MSCTDEHHASNPDHNSSHHIARGHPYLEARIHTRCSGQARSSGEFNVTASLPEAVMICVPCYDKHTRMLIAKQMVYKWRDAIKQTQPRLPKRKIFIDGKHRKLSALPLDLALHHVRLWMEEAIASLQAEVVEVGRALGVDPAALAQQDSDGAGDESDDGEDALL